GAVVALEGLGVVADTAHARAGAAAPRRVALTTRAGMPTRGRDGGVPHATRPRAREPTHPAAPGGGPTPSEPGRLLDPGLGGARVVRLLLGSLTFLGIDV